jgi:thioredoxin-like negative regulator of GroEL
MTKKQESANVKKNSKEITLKQFGQNIAIVIDGKSFSKRFIDAQKREELKELVKKYNSKNIIKIEKEIINLMLEGKTTEKERKEKAVEKIKKEAKEKAPNKPKTKAPAVKVLTKEQKLAEAKKLLEEDGFIVSKQAPATYTGRRKEY